MYANFENQFNRVESVQKRLDRAYKTRPEPHIALLIGMQCNEHRVVSSSQGEHTVEDNHHNAEHLKTVTSYELGKSSLAFRLLELQLIEPNFQLEKVPSVRVHLIPDWTKTLQRLYNFVVLKLRIFFRNLAIFLRELPGGLSPLRLPMEGV